MKTWDEKDTLVSSPWSPPKRKGRRGVRRRYKALVALITLYFFTKIKIYSKRGKTYFRLG